MMISKVAVLFSCLTLVHSFAVPIGYNFGYDIQSPIDGQGREESRDADGNVRGSYFIRDADGRQRKVTYTAGADGFNAQIDSNEPGVLAKSSANAQVNGAEVPVGSLSSSADDFELGSGQKLVPSGYKFGYDIQGPDSQSREESGDALGNVKGSYSLMDVDGRQRKVEYIADADGFKAIINTNEHGTANKSPADAVMISPYPAPMPVEPLPVHQVVQPSGPVSFQKELNLPGLHETSRPISSQFDSTFSKAIEHTQIPVAIPAISVPVHMEQAQLPVSLEFSQKGLKTPFISAPAPAPVYQTRTHSSFTFNKVPVSQEVVKSFEPVQQEIKSVEPVQQEIRTFEPVQQVKSVEPVQQIKSFEPIEQIKSFEPIEQMKSFEPIEQIKSFEPVPESKPIEQVQQMRFEQVQQELKTYEPPRETKAPVQFEQKYLPAKEPIATKTYSHQRPVYQSRIYSSTSYSKLDLPIVQLEQREIIKSPVQQQIITKQPPVQQQIITKQEPVQQEIISKKAPVQQEIISKKAPVQQLISNPTPVQQIISPRAQTKSTSHSKIHFERKSYETKSLSNPRFEQRKL